MTAQQAPGLDCVRAIVFPGVHALPQLIAQRVGFFARHKIACDVTFTKNSSEQRSGLASGAYEFSHGAVDNAVSMVEQGNDDIVILTGSDQSFNKLMVQPELRGYEDLSGRVLGVDAPDTAFALVAYEMLARRGLLRGRDYKVAPIGAAPFRLAALKARTIDFSLLTLPFNLDAERLGLRALDEPAAVIGPYQSVGTFARRSFVRVNTSLVVRYIAATIEAFRYLLDPAHAADVCAMLREDETLPPQRVEDCYRTITQPSRGFTTDAAILLDGMKTLLKEPLNSKVDQCRPCQLQRFSADLSSNHRQWRAAQAAFSLKRTQVGCERGTNWRARAVRTPARRS